MEKSYVRIEFANSTIKKKVKKGQKEVHDFAFYKSGKYLLYIGRDGAVYIQEADLDIEKLKKEGVNVVDYMHSRVKKNTDGLKSGVYSLFDLNADDVDIELEKKKLSKLKNGQNVWEMIINAGQLGVDNYLINKKQWAEILDKNLSKLFKENNIDKNNIEGHFVIHTNTDFPHVHLSFWEKTPSYVAADGSLKFREKGKFSKKSIDAFNKGLSVAFNKSDVDNEYQKLFKIKPAIWDMRKHIRAGLVSSALAKDFSFLKNINLINDYFHNKKNKSYRKVDDEVVKEAIWDTFKFLKEKNNEVLALSEKYQNALDELRDKTFKSESVEKLKMEFIDKENRDFETQIGNTIIKYCVSVSQTNSSDIRNIHLNAINKNKKKKINLMAQIKRFLRKFDYLGLSLYYKQKQGALKNFYSIKKMMHSRG
ncbi:relaxase MobL [Mycoplasmopsis primatum]|uniref:relaxase MobL n=1 Tax=Mycoplasmopsis primatum TaxID=55604 RepID=UPI00049608C1|nr:relaxase MobL [Mycoplasmopsis primatum]